MRHACWFFVGAATLGSCVAFLGPPLSPLAPRRGLQRSPLDFSVRLQATVSTDTITSPFENQADVKVGILHDLDLTVSLSQLLTSQYRQNGSM